MLKAGAVISDGEGKASSEVRTRQSQAESEVPSLLSCNSSTHRGIGQTGNTKMSEATPGARESEDSGATSSCDGSGASPVPQRDLLKDGSHSLVAQPDLCRVCVIILIGLESSQMLGLV